MLRHLLALFGETPTAPAPRLTLDRQPDRLYAIGDVHGCLGLLHQLEARIIADAADAPGEKLIVMLGDLVDRGPASAQVIDHMLAPPPAAFSRICLRGNHEAMMLACLRDPRRAAEWLDNGGRETLLSYGIPSGKLSTQITARALENLVQSHIPPEHLAFLEQLPVLLDTPGAIFVHAGLRPGLRLADQSDDDLIWFRDQYRNDYTEFGRPVVHGHMPRAEALVTPYRIGIDTGAYASGRLTAVRLMSDADTELFVSQPNSTARDNQT